MPDLQKEREDLAKADQHIAEGERRVSEQMALIERTTAQGQDTTLAEEFFQDLDQTLKQRRAHRRLILDWLAHG